MTGATERRRTIWREIRRELAAAGAEESGRWVNGRAYAEAAAPEGAAGNEWEDVMAVLEGFPACDPPAGAAEETALWVTRLPLPGAFRRKVLAAAPSRPGAFWSALCLVKSQVRVFSRAFWVAAAAVTAIAALATLGLEQAGAQVTMSAAARLALPLAVVSPVIAALSVSYALRSFGRGPWEVEFSCPMTPAGMAVGRLVIVLAYVTGLALAATFGLWAAGGWARASGALWLVVESWLAPVLFLGAFCFHVSLRFSPLTGTAVSLGLWAVAVGLHVWRAPLSPLTLPGQPGQTTTAAVLVVLAAVLVAASARLAERAAERAGIRAA